MKVIIKKEISMEKAKSPGQVVHNMKVNSKTMDSTVMEHIPGMMVVNMLEIGRIIAWKDGVCIHGTMVKCMKDNSKMIRNKVKVHLLGLMVISIKGNGQMENNTEKENIFLKMDGLKWEI